MHTNSSIISRLKKGDIISEDDPRGDEFRIRYEVLEDAYHIDTKISKGWQVDLKAVSDGHSNRFFVSPNSKQNIFTLYREFKFKFQFIQFKNLKNYEITKWYRKLDFFDIAAIIGLVVFLTIQQFQGWFLADTFNLILDNLFSTIVMGIILLLIFLFLCLPIDVIELNTSSIKYRIEIPLKKEKQSFINRIKSIIFENLKVISDREMKKVFLIRLGGICTIIIGCCIYMTVYFAFFF